jgi:hypothetical protein
MLFNAGSPNILFISFSTSAFTSPPPGPWQW